MRWQIAHVPTPIYTYLIFLYHYHYLLQPIAITLVASVKVLHVPVMTTWSAMMLLLYPPLIVPQVITPVSRGLYINTHRMHMK